MTPTLPLAPTREPLREPQRERIVTFEPAFDRRDPNPAINYGIHGVSLRFVLKGPEGAVQFLLYTNWQLPHVTAEQDAKPREREYTHLSCHPLPADLGYHSPTPQYDGQTRMDDCKYIDGGCFYDGSSLNADPVYERLLREGDAGVWAALDDYYTGTLLRAAAQR
jgi:hypothetical protein